MFIPLKKHIFITLTINIVGVWDFEFYIHRYYYQPYCKWEFLLLMSNNLFTSYISLINSTPDTAWASIMMFNNLPFKFL